MNKQFYQIKDKTELYEFLKSQEKRPEVSKQDKKFMSEVRVSILYNCTILFLIVDGKIVSLLSYTITRRYLNIYFIYTVLEQRGNGYNRELINNVLFNRSNEIDRVYSIASTKASARMYDKFGFTFWGLNKLGEIVTDTEFMNMSVHNKAKKAVVGECFQHNEQQKIELIDKLVK